MKNYKVTSNRNVKPNKVKTYKNKKQIETCVLHIFMYIVIQTRKHENIEKCMQKRIYLKL